MAKCTIDNCDHEIQARGMCNMHYKRAQRRGMKCRQYTKLPTLRERVMERSVSVDLGHGTPCLLWKGGKISDGYGTIKFQGENLLVHRAMYEDQWGPIPEGLEIDHCCNVRNCCNPYHLLAMTHEENASLQGGAHMHLWEVPTHG